MKIIALGRELPHAMTVHHGTEFPSKVFDERHYLQGVKLDFIRTGKPTESGHMESFSGSGPLSV